MAETARRDVFQAIADPTRRQIIDLVGAQPMNLNSIADHFNISRPAVSQHIKLLQECGVLTVETVGRERYCRLAAQNLIPAFLWLEHHQKDWKRRIDSFESHVNKLKSKKEQRKK